MKIFIVHAHPEPQSFCSAMKDTAVETFQHLGHEVQVSDLHQMKWNPVASGDDFGVRSQPDYLVYALEQRESYKSGQLSPDIQAEIEKLKLYNKNNKVYNFVGSNITSITQTFISVLIFIVFINSLPKLKSSIHITMICYGNSWHIIFLCFLKHRRYLRCAI